MYTIDLDPCEIVLNSLSNNRTIDEQTFASINTLTERLENVRRLHRSFIDIEFSPQVQALAEQEMKLAVS